MRKFAVWFLFVVSLCVLLAPPALAAPGGQRDNTPGAITYRAPKATYQRPAGRTVKVADSSAKVDKADFIFLIDATGSMGWCIDSVKSNVVAFAQSLEDQGVDARFSIIEFQDITCDGVDSTIIHKFGSNLWTSDSSAVESVLESITAKAGGDYPETPTDAIAKIFNSGYTFRTGASYYAFLLTDASAKGSADDPSIMDMSEAASKLRSMSIHTSVVSTSDLEEHYKPLYGPTDGKFINIDSSDYYTLMLEVADWVASISKGELKVDALERGKASDSIAYSENEGESFGNKYLIGRIATSGKYMDYTGAFLEEKSIAQISEKEYGKIGLAADGNTRLILRVKAPGEGSVTFTLPDELKNEGALLEDLNGNSSTPSTGIATTSLSDGSWQVSVVLTAPKNYPNAYGLSYTQPYHDFEVSIAFTAKSSTTPQEITKTLTLYPTPVVFVHGFLAESAQDTFGWCQPTGVWHQLHFAGIKTFFCNYENTKGPSDVILNADYSGPKVFDQVAEVFRRFNAINIACTKVDFVTHSMGGLMARLFIQADKGNLNTIRSYGHGMVRRVITIATPHRGSPEADLVLNIGNIATALSRTRDPLLAWLIRKGLNEISALSDLSTESTLIKTLGWGKVPMHAIYGKIKDDLGPLVQMIKEGGVKAVRDMPLLDPLTAGILEVGICQFSDEWGEDVVSRLFDILFDGDDHDIAVGETSAHGDFTSSTSSGYDKWAHNHMSICDQDDVGNRVVELLQNPEEGNFKKFAASSSSLVRRTRAAKSRAVLSSEKLITERFSLTATAATVDEAGTVTYTGTAEDPFEHNVYMIIETNSGARIFKAAEAGENSFTVDVAFSSEDVGVMNVSCFTQGDGDYVYISNTEQLVVKPDLSTITALSFPGKEGITYTQTVSSGDEVTLEERFIPGMIYTNVSSDIALGLYATLEDGTAYNVSSPLMGTVWTVDDPSIAAVTTAGKVRGLKEGTTSLTASLEGLTASISVDVGPDYTSLEDSGQESEDSEGSEGSEDSSDSESGDDSSNGEKIISHAKGSSGGCDTGFASLTLLAALGALWRKR